jgi:Kef-type K+ transport system membrane component KefB
MTTSLQIMLFLALLILAAKLAGALAGRLGLPMVLGELLAGVALGPTLLNIWGASWLQAATPTSVTPESEFKILADLGVVLLMFVAGLETDVQMMRKAMGPAFWAAAGGVVLPMVGAAAVSRAAGLGWQESIFIGTILTATSVTITAQTLMNLKKLKSRAGSTILGAAVIDDVLGLIVLSMVIALGPELANSGQASWGSLAITLGRMAVALILIFWLGPPLTRWIFKHAARFHDSHTEAAAALIVAFLLAVLAEWLGGMAAITGSYLAGLFVAATLAHQKVTHELHPMVNAFFGPLFFVSIGLEINAWQLGGHFAFFTILLVIALLGKIVGCGLGTFFNGFPARESVIVGVGMIPRGEVGLITASLGWTAGLVTRDIYVEVVVLVLVTTLVTPALLRFAFPKDALAEAVATGASLDSILEAVPGEMSNPADL